jgi:hypothetical protein
MSIFSYLKMPSKRWGSLITRGSTLIIFVIVLLMHGACMAFQEVSMGKSELIARFDQIDLATNGGDGYSKSTNEMGFLAWGENYFIEAYLDMYEGTGNQKYLDKFVQHADRIIANTDKALNIRDYKGRLLVGWSSTKYNVDKVRVVYLVHTGMIVYPFIRFSSIIKKDDYSKQYRSAAVRYRQVSVEALSSFNNNWIYNKQTKEGYYRYDADEPKDLLVLKDMPLPFNQQLAAGRAVILLCKETGEESYCEKASGLARHFKNRLQHDTNGANIWNYWYDDGFKRYAAVESYSYAAIDIDFAIVAQRNGIVFEQSDIDGFLKTYHNNIFLNGEVAIQVNGAGRAKNAILSGGWLDLSLYDCSIWEDWVNVQQVSKSSSISSLAKLIKYYDHCSRLKVKTPDHKQKGNQN